MKNVLAGARITMKLTSAFFFYNLTSAFSTHERKCKICELQLLE